MNKRLVIESFVSTMIAVVITNFVVWFAFHSDFSEQPGITALIKRLEARISFLEEQEQRAAISPAIRVYTKDQPDKARKESNPKQDTREPPQQERTNQQTSSTQHVLSEHEFNQIILEEQRIRLQSSEQTWQKNHRRYLQTPESFALNNVSPLRASLGDTLYEQFLKAKGRTTAVAVSSIAAESFAAEAGLMRGDLITHYNGERIFHLYELNALSVQGQYGEWITIDIVRDGQPMQLMIARGPLGFARL